MKNQWLHLSLVLFTAAVSANPKGHEVKQGSAVFQFKDKLVEIHANDRSIIEWQEFSIDAGEMTRFVQPHQSAIVLNKVQGLNRSLINGVLEANGRVVLVNPHGVVVGKTGVINTAEFIASTTDVLDQDWNLKTDATLNFQGSGAAVINHEGVIQATSVDRSRGRVLLIAAEVNVDGSIKSNRVELLGDQIVLQNNALIDVSSPQGGGAVLIGGDFHGNNPEVRNSLAVVMQEGAVILANATEKGDGGQVVLWSDKFTDFQGLIEARGGPEGGDGGFVEVSSLGFFNPVGLANTLAPKGNTGMLLLDPTDITIGPAANSANVTFAPVPMMYQFVPAGTPANIQASVIQTQLGLTNVTIDTNAINTSAAAGTIVWQSAAASDIVWNTNNSLTLNAASDITIGASLQCTAAGSVTITTAGAYTQHSTAPLQSTIDAGTGSISITATNDVNIYANNLGGGNAQLNVNGAGTITVKSLTGSITIGSTTQPAGANASAQTGMGDLTLTAQKDINIFPTNVGTGAAYVISGANLIMTATTGTINVGDPAGIGLSLASANASKNLTMNAATGINVTSGVMGGADAEILGGPNGFMTQLTTTTGNITVTSITSPTTAEIGTSGGNGEIDLKALNGDIIMNSNLGGQVSIASHDHLNITGNNLTITTTGTNSTAKIDVASGTGVGSLIQLAGSFNASASGTNAFYNIQYQNSFLTLNAAGSMNIHNTASTAINSGIHPLGLGGIFNINGNLFVDCTSALATTEVASNLGLTVNVGGDITIDNLQDGRVEFIAGSGLSMTAGGDILIQSSSSAVIPPPIDVLVGVASNTTGPLSMIAGGSITLGRRAQIIVAANDSSFFRAQKNITMGFQSFINTFTPGSGTANQTVTLVVDNQDPVSPFIGNGSFTMDSTAYIMSLDHPAVRIFTARRIQNNIQGTIVGSVFVPGPFSVNTPEEQWLQYYPQAFIGSPFTVFYKEGIALPTTPLPNVNLGFAKLPVVLGNMFDVLDEFEYPLPYYKGYFNVDYSLSRTKSEWARSRGRHTQELPNRTVEWVQIENYRKFYPYRQKFGIRV